jgi:hypothetical protein
MFIIENSLIILFPKLPIRLCNLEDEKKFYDLLCKRKLIVLITKISFNISDPPVSTRLNK